MAPKVMYCDLDGTLCTEGHDGKWEEAKPHPQRIDWLRQFKRLGWTIVIWTARASCYESKSKQEEVKTLTMRQLREWGIPFDSVDFNKPVCTCFVDDKAYNTIEAASCRFSIMNEMEESMTGGAPSQEQRDKIRRTWDNIQETGERTPCADLPL